jgi:hypothetical protein
MGIHRLPNTTRVLTTTHDVRFLVIGVHASEDNSSISCQLDYILLSLLWRQLFKFSSVIYTYSSKTLSRQNLYINTIYARFQLQVNNSWCLSTYGLTFFFLPFPSYTSLSVLFSFFNFSFIYLRVFLSGTVVEEFCKYFVDATAFPPIGDRNVSWETH